MSSSSFLSSRICVLSWCWPWSRKLIHVSSSRLSSFISRSSLFSSRFWSDYWIIQNSKIQNKIKNRLKIKHFVLIMYFSSLNLNRHRSFSSFRTWSREQFSFRFRSRLNDLYSWIAFSILYVLVSTSLWLRCFRFWLFSMSFLSSSS